MSELLHPSDLFFFSFQKRKSFPPISSMGNALETVSAYNVGLPYKVSDGVPKGVSIPVVARTHLHRTHVQTVDSRHAYI